MSVESQKKFTDALDDLITYYANEFEITFAEVVGVLTMTAMDLSANAREAAEEDEEHV